MAGAVMFAVGLGATIVIGILSPFTVGYFWLHIQLAYIAFIGICAGTACHLVRPGRLPVACLSGGLYTTDAGRYATRQDRRFIFIRPTSAFTFLKTGCTGIRSFTMVFTTYIGN